MPFGGPGLKVEIDGDASGLDAALDGASKSVGGFSGVVSKIPISKITAAVKGVAKVAQVTTKVLVAGKDAAAAEEAFAIALGNVGINAETSAAATDKAIAASQRLAFTDDETRNSLVSLATATGDMESALDLLTVAQDVARLSGKDLEVAADAVAKAHQGQDSSLRRLIPGLEKGATGMDTIALAQEAAAGAADTFADSGSSMGKKVRIAFEEVTESIGMALLPMLKKLGEALGPLIISLLEIAKSILPILVPWIETLGRVATIAAKGITKIADAVNRLIGRIKALLSPLREAVSGLQKLDFNPFSASGGSAASTVVAASRSGMAPAASGPVTINIIGDPAVIEARVVRALRGYQSRNGTGSVFALGRQ